MPHWWHTIHLLPIIGPAATVFGANYDATQDRTHLDMIPHVVELHRVAVDVHALFAAAPHRDRNEMKLLQTTMPPAAARGSVVSTPTAARQRTTYLRTRSCRIWSRNLDGDWSNIIFLLPSSPSNQSLHPSAPLDPMGFPRESNRPEGSTSVLRRATELLEAAAWREAVRSAPLFWWKRDAIRKEQAAGEMDREWRMGDVNEGELKGVSATFYLRQSQPSNIDPTVK